MAKPQKSKDDLHGYVRYAGLGFEVLACILVFVGLGYGLDQWLETEKPWFTLVLSLLGCAAAMYLLIRAFTKP